MRYQLSFFSLSSCICSLRPSSAVSLPPAKLNEGDALLKCHPECNQGDASCHVETLHPFKEPMKRGRSYVNGKSPKAVLVLFSLLKKKEMSGI